MFEALGQFETIQIVAAVVLGIIVGWKVNRENAMFLTAAVVGLLPIDILIVTKMGQDGIFSLKLAALLVVCGWTARLLKYLALPSRREDTA